MLSIIQKNVVICLNFTSMDTLKIIKRKKGMIIKIEIRTKYLVLIQSERKVGYTELISISEFTFVNKIILIADLHHVIIVFNRKYDRFPLHFSAQEVGKFSLAKGSHPESHFGEYNKIYKACKPAATS